MHVPDTLATQHTGPQPLRAGNLRPRRTRTEWRPLEGGRPGGVRSWLWLSVILLGILVVAGALLSDALSREVVGLLSMTLMLLLMLAGVHIGLAMVGAGSLGLLALGGTSVMTSTLQESVYNPTATWQLSVIPTFILMGTALWKSGLTQRAFDAARMWLGNVPGGLALTTTAAGGGLAASSGSTIALTHALGRVAIPEMLRAKYRPGFAIGVTATVGAVGQIIPPSVLLVVYSGAAQTSVGSQLMAGIVPGILMLLTLFAFILLIALLSPKTAPRRKSETPLPDKFKGLVGVLPLATVAFVVIGGIASGLFTPTESAAAGAIIAFVLGWATRPNTPKTPRSLGQYLREVVGVSLASTAGIFLLLIGVHVLTRVVTLSRLANGLTDQIVALGLTATTFLLLLVVLYLVLGMFMDTMAIILLTVPVLAVPLTELGIDLIWFGVFLIIMVEIGMITPPMGILCFILHRVVQDREVNQGKPISLMTIFAGCVPFVILILGFVLLIIFVPEIVTWLPEQLATIE